MQPNKKKEDQGDDDDDVVDDDVVRQHLEGLVAECFDNKESANHGSRESKDCHSLSPIDARVVEYLDEVDCEPDDSGNNKSAKTPLLPTYEPSTESKPESSKRCETAGDGTCFNNGGGLSQSLPGAYAECPGGGTSSSRASSNGNDDDDDVEVDECSIEKDHEGIGVCTTSSTIRNNGPEIIELSSQGQNESLATTTDVSLVAARPVNEEQERTIAHADEVDLEAQELEENNNASSKKGFLLLLAGAVAMAAVLVSAILLVAVLLSRSSESSPDEEEVHIQHELTNKQVLEVILPSYTLQTIQEDPNHELPQTKAFHWLEQDPNFGDYSDSRLLQRYILAVLYHATNKEAVQLSSIQPSTRDDSTGGWKKHTHWLSYDHHECEWEFPISYHLEWRDLTKVLQGESPCNSNFMYTSLRLSKNGLSGQLPLQLGILTSLTALDLSYNALSGTLPPIGSLSQLKTLVLGKNELEGRIAEDTLPSSLHQLVIYSNQFTGSLPSSLGLCTNLKALAAGDIPTLTGPIPTEIGHLLQLGMLVVEENNMTGPLPSELGLLRDLEILYLSQNAFSGWIPSELGRLHRANHTHFESNEFHGTIPTQLGGMSMVEKLYLNYNHLEGNIPSQVGMLSNLRRLKVNRNLLTGSIPYAEMSVLPRLEYFDALQNKNLTGFIPEQMCNLSDGLDVDCTPWHCGCQCSCGYSY